MLLTLVALLLQTPPPPPVEPRVSITYSRLAELEAAEAELREVREGQLGAIVENVPRQKATCDAIRAETDPRPISEWATELTDEVRIATDRERAALDLAEATFCVGPYLSRP